MSKVENKIIDRIVFNQKGDKVHAGGLIGGSWYSFGLFESEAKFPLKEKQTVSFLYEQGDKFGVVDISTVRVSQTLNKQTYNKGGYKKDNSGVETGHALNGAMIFLKDSPNTYEELTSIACEVHDVTMKVKEWYAEANPSFNDYAVGASCGNAIHNALKMGVSLNQLEDRAKEILTSVIPVIMKHVKGE